ncbi:MAG: NAD(P)H-hydrate dehydratase [Acidobacteriota bacterium]
MRVLDAWQMRSADAHAIEELGLPSAVLMESAGLSVVEEAHERLGGLEGRRLLVLCGSGNNGGDGMVIARRASDRGADVTPLLLSRSGRLSEDANAQAAILERLGLPLEPCDEERWSELAYSLEGYDLAIDALLGTGFDGRLEGLLARVATDLNASNLPVLAVDVPSGLCGDHGGLPGPVIAASATVTFAAAKYCHVFAPAGELCGDLVVADIGIPEMSLDRAEARLETIEHDELAEILDELEDRPADTHKGENGHVVIVGGRLGSAGATVLAGRAAMTAGAGLCTIALPDVAVPALAAHPELMALPLPSTDDGQLADGADVEAILERASVLVIGPGWGTGEAAAELLATLLAKTEVPTVLDADALNLLASLGEVPSPDGEGCPLVLTPHPGELGRLLTGFGHEPLPRGHRADERLAPTRKLATELEATIVAKGYRTLVVEPDEPALVSLDGGPALATAGSGDVLAGLIGGLLAQDLTPRAAAALGVVSHGLAGEVAEERRGVLSTCAGDLVDAWPLAVHRLADEQDEGDDSDS